MGHGKHSKGSGIENKYKLKKFIIEDLLKYNPPIKTTNNVDNDGRIDVDIKELQPYINGINNNDALRKLKRETTNVNDWYLHTICDSIHDDID